MDMTSEDVSRVVWDWRGEREASRGPEPVLGGLVRMLVVMAVFGAIALWRGHTVVAAALGIYALINIAMAAAWPRGFHGHARLWGTLGRGGAAVVGTVLLAVLYFVLFTPAALILRLMGRRPLELRFRSDEETYWRDVPQKEHGDKEYRRQF
jgi:hypothetical protein